MDETDRIHDRRYCQVFPILKKCASGIPSEKVLGDNLGAQKSHKPKPRSGTCGISAGRLGRVARCGNFRRCKP